MSWNLLHFLGREDVKRDLVGKKCIEAVTDPCLPDQFQGRARHP